MSVFDTIAAASLSQVVMAVHGQAVTYTPAGGDPVSITAIVDRQQTDDRTDEDGLVVVEGCVVTIWHDAGNGVAAPAIGDAVTIGGTAFVVHELGGESAGLIELDLRRVAVTEKSATQHRIQR